MKNILKLMFAVGAVAQAAFGAGTWVSVPLPSAVTSTTKIQDCESDSKGNIWYTVTFGGLFSQSADGNTWTAYPGVPVSDSSAYMGIHIDRSTDSVFVGSIRGTVQAGKNGVFHSLPSVPLTVRGSQYTSTRVSDLYRDANGYLTAVTDSMVWWLDGDTWRIIGEKSDYDYLSLGVGKELPNGDFAIYSHIIHKDRTVTIHGVDGQGFSVGPTGTIYAGGGVQSTATIFQTTLHQGRYIATDPARRTARFQIHICGIRRSKWLAMDTPGRAHSFCKR